MNFNQKIFIMKFLSLEPFVPSGAHFQQSKLFFLELGFKINWELEDYIGFQREECRFVLQHFDKKEFAENFMLSVKVDNIIEFRNMVIEKNLPGKFGIRVSEITQEPYGREVNIIDLAGVCWHFVEQ